MADKEAVNRIMQQLESGGLQNPPRSTLSSGKRQVTKEQGSPDIPQTVPADGTTGVGAILGSLLSLPITKGKGFFTREGVTGTLSALGDLAETGVMQAIDPERNVTVGTAFKSAGKEALASFAGGAAVQVGVKGFDVSRKVGKRLFDSFISRMTPEAQMIKDFMDSEIQRIKSHPDVAQFSETRPNITIAEATDSAGAEMIDNAARNAMLGADEYRDYLVQRENVMRKIGTNIAESFGGREADPGVIGDVLSGIFKENPKILDAPAKILRNKLIEEAATNKWFGPVGALRQKAKATIDLISRTGKLNKKLRGGREAEGILQATKDKPPIDTGLLDAKGSKIFKGEIEGDEVFGGLPIVMDQLANAPRSMPIGDLIEIRSTLMDYERVISKSKRFKGTTLHKEMNELIGLTGSAIEDGLSQAGVPAKALRMWNDSRATFKKTKDLFADPMASELIKSARNNPAGVVNAIFKTRDQNGLRLVQRTKEMLLPKDIRDKVLLEGDSGFIVPARAAAWRKVQAEAMTTLFHNAQDGKVWSGQKFLDSLDSFERPILNEMFGREITDRLYKFGQTLLTQQTRNPTSTGGMAVQFTQIGAILAGLRGKIPMEAAAILIAPKKAANIMLTKEGMDNFINFIGKPASDPKWTRALSRILAIASTKIIEDKEFIEKPQRVSNREDPLLDQLLSGPALLQ